MFTAFRVRPVKAVPPPSVEPDSVGSSVHHDDEPLTLPEPWSPSPRPPVPLLAAIVPVLGAVALWLVTGSVLALMLAALGPLIAGATVLDAARGNRRARHRSEEAAVSSRAEIGEEIERRHERERQRLWSRHPNVRVIAQQGDQLWRRKTSSTAAVVVGSGEAVSSVRVTGGGGDERNIALRRRAATVQDAPIAVPLEVGIAVVGPALLAAAVHRALIVQLCLIYPPGQIRLTGLPRSDSPSWMSQLPHTQVPAAVTVSCAADQAADILICHVPDDELPPVQCGTIVRVHGIDRATVERPDQAVPARVEALGYAQAATVAGQLAAEHERVSPTSTESAVMLAALLADAPTSASGRLPAVIGEAAGGAALVDLVADGPHAVVAGMTGAGKSELLVSWIVALAATHSPEQVTFLLADFKGGSAFTPLMKLPHVTGVITDLDAGGARRAIESLRAELRFREQRLADVGARDLTDPRAGLPRLVVVVDEFAALLSDQPDLHAVFVDLAARGRALGIHLILGTQRVTGVIRENLLANCPLRISLRVADVADSRAVIGAEEAARLPAGAAGRGIAFVRRAALGEPERIRVALCSHAAIAAVATEGATEPRVPWLPELPNRVDLAEVAELPHGDSGTLILGMADDPSHQRRRRISWHMHQHGVMVLGRAGSGKSVALRTLACQAERVIEVPADPEAAWDVLSNLSASVPPSGTMIVIDDLDSLAARFPADYAREVIEKVEYLVRSSAHAGVFVVAAAQRLAGVASRVADLLPHRVILATGSRSDHVALGGDAAQYAPDLPPGRGSVRGWLVQVADAGLAEGNASSRAPSDQAVASDRARPAGAQHDPAPAWWPHPGISGYVCRPGPQLRERMQSWQAEGVRVLSVDEYGLSDSSHAPGQTMAGAVPGVTTPVRVVQLEESSERQPLVLVGDAEQWQRNWRTLTQLRAEHTLVIDGACGSEYRLLTGDRMTPPYCEAGRARAWCVQAGAPPRRVTVAAVLIEVPRGTEPAPRGPSGNEVARRGALRRDRRR